MVETFPAADKHYYILDFLIKITERYREDGCAKSFVLDLVKLGEPKLLRGVLFLEAAICYFHHLYKENVPKLPKYFVIMPRGVAARGIR